MNASVGGENATLHHRRDSRDAGYDSDSSDGSSRRQGKPRTNQRLSTLSAAWPVKVHVTAAIVGITAVVWSAVLQVQESHGSVPSFWVVVQTAPAASAGCFFAVSAVLAAVVQAGMLLERDIRRLGMLTVVLALYVIEMWMH